MSKALNNIEFQKYECIINCLSVVDFKKKGGITYSHKSLFYKELER
jgi:hypothetical protein